MSKLNEIYEHVKTGVFGVYTFQDGKIIGSGTGFVLEDYFITNYHVVEVALNDALTSQNNSGIMLVHVNAVCEKKQDKVIYEPSLKISKSKLLQNLKTSSEVNAHDYAIFNANITGITINNLKRGCVEEFGVGDEVAFLGYPFGITNIALHRGIISSVYDSGVAKILQLDASTNNGNSGGPVIGVQTGKVIGIVTRKQDGLRENFKTLKRALKSNADVLSKCAGRARIAGIDPMRTMEIQQLQLLNLCEEIERSANVGIGYAHTITPILNEIDRLNEQQS